LKELLTKNNSCKNYEQQNNSQTMAWKLSKREDWGVVAQAMGKQIHEDQRENQDVRFGVKAFNVFITPYCRQDEQLTGIPSGVHKTHRWLNLSVEKKQEWIVKGKEKYQRRK